MAAYYGLHLGPLSALVGDSLAIESTFPGLLETAPRVRQGDLPALRARSIPEHRAQARAFLGSNPGESFFADPHPHTRNDSRVGAKWLADHAYQLSPRARMAAQMLAYILARNDALAHAEHFAHTKAANAISESAAIAAGADPLAFSSLPEWGRDLFPLVLAYAHDMGSAELSQQASGPVRYYVNALSSERARKDGISGVKQQVDSRRPALLALMARLVDKPEDAAELLEALQEHVSLETLGLPPISPGAGPLSEEVRRRIATQAVDAFLATVQGGSEAPTRVDAFSHREWRTGVDRLLRIQSLRIQLVDEYLANGQSGMIALFIDLLYRQTPASISPSTLPAVTALIGYRG